MKHKIKMLISGRSRTLLTSTGSKSSCLKKIIQNHAIRYLNLHYHGYFFFFINNFFHICASPLMRKDNVNVKILLKSSSFFPILLVNEMSAIHIIFTLCTQKETCLKLIRKWYNKAVCFESKKFDLHTIRNKFDTQQGWQTHCAAIRSRQDSHQASAGKVSRPCARLIAESLGSSLILLGLVLLMWLSRIVTSDDRPDSLKTAATNIVNRGIEANKIFGLE